MKKIIVLGSILTLSATTFAASEYASQKLSTSELKAMDCATLAVEKANSKRALEAAEKNLVAAQTQTPGKSLGKWAGMAGGALSAFGGNSEKTAKANQVLGNLSAEDTSEAANVQLQNQIKTDAQTNIDNISIYQGSKKCKI